MILLLIIAWTLYAWLDAKEEAAWSYPFRSFDWAAFESQKRKQLRKAHSSGAGGVFIMLVITSSLFACGITETVKDALLHAVAGVTVSGLSYWLVFDIGFALAIGQKWHYLGSTARTDQLVKNGRVKAYVCAAVIAIILAAYLIFL